ncbi:hypothetical protein DKE48_019025 (plasmid) [Acinetobacter nosocomialis]|nr:hypothetical protein DKE48_019025 [Acinetobacter nosocomialis]
MIPASCAQYLTQLGYNLVDPYDTNLKKRFYNSLWVKNIVVSGFNIRLGVFFWIGILLILQECICLKMI